MAFCDTKNKSFKPCVSQPFQVYRIGILAFTLQ